MTGVKSLSPDRENLDLLGKFCDDEIVAAANAPLEFLRGESTQIANVHPVAFGTVGRLDDVVDLGEFIELLGGALEGYRVDDFAIHHEDDEHFPSHFENEAFSPLLYHGGLRQ